MLYAQGRLLQAMFALPNVFYYLICHDGSLTSGLGGWYNRRTMYSTLPI